MKRPPLRTCNAHRRSRVGGRWALLGCCLCLAGCGVQAYEAQLNNANELFTYQNRLDQVLSRTPWEAPGYGVSMRVPLGFSPIPGPAPVVAKEGEESPEPAVDQRQPTYLGVPEIEGLIGAWKASVPATDGTAVVFLYVFGNHERMLNNSPSGEGLPANEYFNHLEAVLQTQLGVTIEPCGQSLSEPNRKCDESIPREEKFVRRKNFQYVNLVPTDGAMQQLQLPQLNFYLYELGAGSVQTAILLVAPKTVQAGHDPDKTLRVALETLAVSDQRPQRNAEGQVSQPAGKSGF